MMTITITRFFKPLLSRPVASSRVAPLVLLSVYVSLLHFVFVSSAYSMLFRFYVRIFELMSGVLAIWGYG
jgi:hypothetical protein